MDAHDGIYGRRFTRLNPMTGDTASTSPAMDAPAAGAVADAAAAAFPTWSALGPNAWRGSLMKAADALEAKAPLIVLEDADLDEAVKVAAFGAFMNQGQICMSTERIIVVDGVADAFAAKFKAKVAGMAVGDPREGKAPLGAVVDRKTVDSVRGLIDDALANGAEQLVGGDSDGVLMPAHVIDRVTPSMRLSGTRASAPSSASPAPAMRRT